MNKRSIGTVAFLLLVVAWTASCSTFITRKPWRTYDEMPFDAQKWREGDEIERGRMLRDMRNKITGKLLILALPFRSNSTPVW